MVANQSIDLLLLRLSSVRNPLPYIVSRSLPPSSSLSHSLPSRSGLQSLLPLHIVGGRRGTILTPCLSNLSPIAHIGIPPAMDARCPVLLFDVMGTLVRDPFYEDVPAFFGISMKELLAIKHPTAWVEFEKGVITEEELICNFFKDKRQFDSSGLKACMTDGYAYLEGIETLLDRLKSRGYQMHAFSNYSPWYELIEEKLKLSQYLNWSFVSCHTGKRKPDPDAFVEVTKQLGLRPSDIVFIDDQARNVEAAAQIGMTALIFESAKQLENELLTLGVEV